jgi:cell division protein FtsI/penicillin-binding protein 2
MGIERGPFYPRLSIVATIFVTTMAVLALRLGYLASAAAEDTASIETRELPAPRGTIWDRNGALIATNEFAYDLGLDLAVAEQGDPAELARMIAPWIGREAPAVEAEIREAIAGESLWLPLAWDLGRDASEALGNQEGMGLHLAPQPRRVYPLGADTAHVTGFIFGDEQTEYGIEASQDAVLKGRPGQLVGYAGTRPRDFRPARAGTDLRLSIDRDLQAAASRALARIIEEQDATGGTVIVLEVATGAILASTSLPSYDPNRFGDVPREDQSVFVDPAVSAIYEPGSVLKAVTLAAALDAGSVTSDSHYQDEGSVEFAGLTINNWDHLAHGWASLQDMMTNSLNVGAVWTAAQLGQDGFYDGLRRFGFGAPIGVDLAGEVSGIVNWPDADPDWYPGNFATNSFGQGMSATPMQVAAAIAAIANDGRYMLPQIVAERLPSDGPSELVPPRLVRQVIRPETARIVRRMMQAVVDDKTVQAAIPGYSVGGKTGTSQIPNAEGYEAHDTIASFCGFLPVEAPRIVIFAKVDRAEAARGSDVAAPLFREVAEAAIAALDIPPDRAVGMGGEVR